MSAKPNECRRRKVVRRVIDAVDRVIAAAEELKKANIALSLEAHRRPPGLKIAAEGDKEAHEDAA
jgi:hypothetical protein